MGENQDKTYRRHGLTKGEILNHIVNILLVVNMYSNYDNSLPSMAFIVGLSSILEGIGKRFNNTFKLAKYLLFL